MMASRQKIYAKLASMDMELSDLPKYSVQHLERLILLLSRKLHSLRAAKAPVFEKGKIILLETEMIKYKGGRD